MRWLPLLLLPSVAAAGPWTRGPGQAYVKMSESAYFADGFRDADGRLQSGVDYRSFSSALYLEVGLLDALQLQLYLPHLVATNHFADTGDRYLTAGGGDAQFGLQVGLPLPIPVAVRGVLKVPLYDAGGIGGREAARFAVAGDGQIDASILLSAGYSLDRFYGFIELGHQARTERFTGAGTGLTFGDGLVWAAQLGFGFAFGLGVALNATGVVPYADDLVTKGYASVGPSLSYPLVGGLAVELGYDRVVQATHSAEGQSATVGVSYNLQ